MSTDNASPVLAHVITAPNEVTFVEDSQSLTIQDGSYMPFPVRTLMYDGVKYIVARAGAFASRTVVIEVNKQTRYIQEEPDVTDDPEIVEQLKKDLPGPVFNALCAPGSKGYPKGIIRSRPKKKEAK